MVTSDFIAHFPFVCFYTFPPYCNSYTIIGSVCGERASEKARTPHSHSMQESKLKHPRHIVIYHLSSSNKSKLPVLPSSNKCVILYSVFWNGVLSLFNILSYSHFQASFLKVKHTQLLQSLFIGLKFLVCW